MTRKFSNPRRIRSASSTKRAVRRERKDETPATPAKILDAASARTTYLRELAVPGATPSSVARKYGVSRQNVHNLTRGYLAQRERDVKSKREKHGSAPHGEYICTICNQLGHNAGRHRTSGEESAA